MRRFLPVLALIVMAPLVAEVPPGSTPITRPGLLLFDLLIYGSGALLIRELVRRRSRGWPSILLPTHAPHPWLVLLVTAIAHPSAWQSLPCSGAFSRPSPSSSPHNWEPT